MRLSLDASRATTRVLQLAFIALSLSNAATCPASGYYSFQPHTYISRVRGNVRRKLERRNWTLASEQAFDMRATTQPDDIADTRS